MTLTVQVIRVDDEAADAGLHETEVVDVTRATCTTKLPLDGRFLESPVYWAVNSALLPPTTPVNLTEHPLEAPCLESRHEVLENFPDELEFHETDPVGGPVPCTTALQVVHLPTITRDGAQASVNEEGPVVPPGLSTVNVAMRS